MTEQHPKSSTINVQQAMDLAIEHHQAGRLAEAEVLYRQILTQQPNHADALHLLGIVAHESGRTHDALELISRAVSIHPNAAIYYNNLGNILTALDKTDEALRAYRTAIKLKSDYADAYNNLGCCLQALEKYEDALIAYRTALELKPNSAQTPYNMGILFQIQGRFDEAITSFQNAIKLNSSHYEAYNKLGNALMAQKNVDAAINAYRCAIELKPDFPDAHYNLGIALSERGQLDAAMYEYRAALRYKPDTISYQSTLIFTMHIYPGSDAGLIHKELLDWNKRHTAPLKQFISPHANNRDPERRLKIGYVSADFRNDVCAVFLDPLLRSHDHQQFDIFCYAQVRRPDALTDKFKSYVDQWRSTVGLSDEQVADGIRTDGIDILVDLKLHTSENRLLVFARKPAPVQMTWLGYPGSTGLDTIDYRLTDPYLDPPGLDDAFYSEESIRLPDCFWCYDPLTQEPPINELPALQNGFVTFGCLNNFNKVNDPMLDIWARVLAAVPDSRLLLLAPQGEARRHIVSQFERAKIAPTRLEFIDRRPRAEYLKLYHRIDLGLDTLPYNGHTTTFDALWMGVPIVTLSGRTAVGRAGKSLLSNVGLPELAAQTEQEYVDIAVKWAGDWPGLAKLRGTLRERMEHSPLMDAKRFVRNVETVYRNVWRKWCRMENVSN